MEYTGENGFIYVKNQDSVIFAEIVPDKFKSHFKNMIAYIIDIFSMSEEQVREQSLIVNGMEHGLEYYLHFYEDPDKTPTYLELERKEAEDNGTEFTLQVMSEEDAEKLLRRISNV